MGMALDQYRLLWEHLEGCDWDALSALFTEDVEVIFQDARLHNAGDLLDYLRAVMQALPDISHEIIDVIESADGDALAGVVVARGTHASNDARFGDVEIAGRSSQFQAVDLLWLRDGRIAKWWAMYDVYERAASLGLALSARSAAGE